MNKIVAILGIIVLITLGGLFFCAGFFTGTTVFPSSTSSSAENVKKSDDGNSISTAAEEAAVDTKSTSISDKIMEILASAAESASSAIPDAINHKNTLTADTSAHVSIDSLLSEIVASHTTDDNCSPERTLQKINIQTQLNSNSLHGKRIVFVGYFKNKIAFEIQKLLLAKGYKAHLESSRTGDSESFIFCGPFKKEENAQRLIKWLQKHNFSAARMVSISGGSIIETLYDATDTNSGLPENAERDIPETPLLSVPSLQPVSPPLVPISPMQSFPVNQTLPVDSAPAINLVPASPIP
ncbi:MAG: hypothetical protein LBB25_01440 [Holosporaceae bacterium]|nr:hypothetical protein [Holosporaceae bacterium]